VANHQIRNLRQLLIEDTVNFENHYHLDRLVKGKARVDRDAAHRWWTSAKLKFRPQCTSVPQPSSRFHLEILTRAVVAGLAFKGGCSNFPDTFYLDQDRLQVLQLEMDDLIHFEICFDMFRRLLQDFNYSRAVSQTTRQRLQTTISAIVGESAPHQSQSWIYNAGPISLEIYRQAADLAGYSPFHNLDYLPQAKGDLLHLFENTYTTHASALEATILPQILACSNKHFNSSPGELFNSLVVPAPPPPPHSFVSTPTPQPDTLPPSPYTNKLAGLTNRVTHIVLLHWRVWAKIAYVHEDEKATQIESISHLHPQHSLSVTSETEPTRNHTTLLQSRLTPSTGSDAQALDRIRTSDPPDPGE
jgi:hypothetical protein